MIPTEYPLTQVLQVKEQRVDTAERLLRQKIDALAKEKKKLEERERERNKVKEHRQAKLDQLREELDHGTTAPKIDQMKKYLDVVDEKLEVEEKKVKEQQEQVALAEENVEEAREILRKRQLELDKLNMHKSGWEKEMRRELQIAEEQEQDEIGNIVYTLRQKGKFGI